MNIIFQSSFPLAENLQKDHKTRELKFSQRYFYIMLHIKINKNEFKKIKHQRSMHICLCALAHMCVSVSIRCFCISLGSTSTRM